MSLLKRTSDIHPVEEVLRFLIQALRKFYSQHESNLMRLSPRELVVLLIMCLVWSFHFVVIKIAVEHVPPLFYAAIRMSLVAILLFPFLRWKKTYMVRVLLAGVFLGALNYAFMFKGIYYADAAASALALELYVPFATLLSVWFLGETIGYKTISGIILALIGVTCIALAKGEASLNIGIIFIVLAAGFEAIGATLVKTINQFKPIELLAWFSLMGAVILWPLTFMIENNQITLLQASDPWLVIGAVFYSAIGASIIGHTSFYWLLQRLPLSVVAPSGLLTTMLAVILSVIFLKEELVLLQIIGGIIVLIGVGVILIRRRQKESYDQDRG